MNVDCGGCQGMGSHKRWCEVAVGRSASMLGRLAEEAESLGDRIGPNEMGAANHAWAAAALLRAVALRDAEEHRKRVRAKLRAVARRLAEEQRRARE